MSSPSEVSSQGTDLGLEAREHAEFPQADSAAPQAQVLALDLASPQSGKGEGGSISDYEVGFSDHDLYEFDSDSEEGERAMRSEVLWGCEGRPGSPADEEDDAALDFIPHLNVECASVVQQMADLKAQGARRYLPRPQSLSLSPESCAAARSAMWASKESGPIGRGAMALSHGEVRRNSAAPVYFCGPERGQVWGNLKSGTKSRMISRDAERRSSNCGPDFKSSEEFSEVQPMRVSMSRKGGGQARSSSPKEPGDAARHSNIHAQASVPQFRGSVMTSAPRRLTSTVGRQASGKLEASSSKKMQNAVWAKGAGRPIYPGAGAIAGALPRATDRKKEAQKKKSLGGGSRITLGRAFPSWGQRLKATPLEPATLPPISGVPLLGKSKGCSLLPSGSKPSKQGGTGKRSSARRAGESQPMTGEDKGSNSDPVLQAQLLTCRPGPHCLSMHRGEFISGNADTRALQVPAVSQPLTVGKGGLPPRGPALSGDQEPTVRAPILEGQQPPSGAQGCPQCFMLQKEIHDLKEQLAVLQSLTDKFQTL